MSMPQAGILATITEFVGAVALGSRVTDTIKNGIINIDRKKHLIEYRARHLLIVPIGFQASKAIPAL